MKRICFAHSTTTIARGRYCGHAVAQCSLHVLCALNDSFRISLPPEAHCSKTEMNYVFSCCCCCLLLSTAPLCPYVLLCSRNSRSVVLMCLGFSLLFICLCLHFIHIAYNFVFVDIYAYLIAFNGQQKVPRAHSQNLSKKIQLRRM